MIVYRRAYRPAWAMGRRARKKEKEKKKEKKAKGRGIGRSGLCKRPLGDQLNIE